MHIPDGFLDTKTCIATYLAAGGSLAYGVKRLKTSLKEEQIPLLGLVGAFVFAAQMINLPIAAGTSGHLLGGVLAALVLGPWAATVVITSILVIQAIFFMDGGIAVMGANIFNMAIVGVFFGYWLFKVLEHVIRPYQIRVMIAAGLSTVTAALVATLELVFSGTVELGRALPVMVGWHVLVGLIEAVITLLIVTYLVKVIPERLFFMQRRDG